MNAKKKGNAFEQSCARWLRRWFPNVMTSRLGNPYLDSCGHDLINTYPFVFQCKAVERGLDPFKVLAEMKEVNNQWKVLLWKKNRRGTLVVMEMSDANQIFDLIKKHDLL